MCDIASAALTRPRNLKLLLVWGSVRKDNICLQTGRDILGRNVTFSPSNPVGHDCKKISSGFKIQEFVFFSPVETLSASL